MEELPVRTRRQAEPANTWTNYTNAGGSQGQTIAGGQTVAIACKIQGFRVADGNTYWYRIASAPWNGAYYVSADAFYNNGQTSGSLAGTPFYDPTVPDCTAAGSGGTDPSTTPQGGVNETAGGVSHTWTNYTNAGGTQGPDIGGGQTVLISCKLTGFQVADGNNWWYMVGSSPWNGNYYVSADAFYNNGATSGSLLGTPFVDGNVPDCTTQSGSGSSPTTGHPSGETAGGVSNTFGNYSHAGSPGPYSVGAGQTIQVTCRAQGFRVADGNTWWYLIASAPWNNVWYVSADPFYNNGATSGSLLGTPFYDPSVPICVNNTESPLYSTSYGSAQSTVHTTSCGAADPVNCASGNFSHSFTDVSISGRGPDIDLVRTYNSLNPTSAGLFGNGWSSTYDQSLNTDSPTRAADGSIVINLDDGSQVTATPNGSGYTTPPETDTTFVANSDGTYTLTRHQNLIETFSAAGQLTSLSDLNGNKTTLAYNSSGQLASITDASGRTVTVTVGTNGLVSSITDPLGRTTTYSYDANNNLIGTSDPLGRTWTFTYDSNDRMLTMTDPRGGVVTNTYQSDGRVSQQTDAAGLTTKFVYTGDNFSALGGTTTITDPHGNVRVEQYANGFLTQVIKAYGTPAQATWSYQYDPTTFGQTQVTDPNGNVTSATYDVHGQVLTSTDATGKTTHYTYNSLEEVTSIQTPLDETTTNTYDSSGNELTSTDPLGGTTTYSYTDSTHPGDLTAVADPDGRVTQYAYDANGDVASEMTTSAPGTTETTSFAYDADGELTCKASADLNAQGKACAAPGSPRVTGTTTYSYDADGEPTSVVSPTGGVTTSVYDADGNATSVTNPDGDVTLTSFDKDNRKLTVEVGANGSTPSTTTSAYDLAPGTGACSSLNGATYCNTTQDGNGNVTVDYFDARDNLIEEQRPASLVTTYTYDLDGNRLTMTDASGRTTTYGYDADNRLTSTSFSDGVTPNVSYAYDADGHRTSMTDGTGTTTYTYDADGRTVSTKNGAGATVDYGYDKKGDVTSITYPNGQTVTRTYDGADRLSTVADWLGNTTTYGYDADGNPTSVAYPNGDTGSATYDAADQLTGTSVGAGGSALLSLADTRDAAGLVTAEVRSGADTGTTKYTYNANGELVQAGTSVYGYDNAGNLTSKATAVQSFNSADELTASTFDSSPTTYGYDPIGDLTSVTQSTGAGTTYAYSQAGEVTSAAQQVAPLTVSGITPNSGAIKGGTTVTISGTGFTGATQVSFGQVAATNINVVSDSQITATVPAQAAGTVDVTVTTPFGTSTTSPADQYTYIFPTVNGVAPNVGPTTGGTSVTISGRFFTSTSKVLFGTTTAKFAVISDTQITATAPVHTAGTVDITVTTPFGTSVDAATDQFTYGHVPTINGLTPKAGPLAGGNTVTIVGTNLTGATSVTFGAMSARSFKVVSATKVTAVAPADAAGSVNVIVTTPYGSTSALASSQYTYLAAPTVTGLSPASGTAAGGTSVTVSGSGFLDASKVTFGGTIASFTVVSNSKISVTSPAHAVGATYVVVSTPGGHNGNVTGAKYTYVTGGAVATSLSPTTKQSAVLTSLTTTSSTLANYTYNGDGLRMSESMPSGTLAFVWDTTTSVPEAISDGTNYYIYGAGGLPLEQISGTNTPTYFFHDGIGSTRALLTSTGTIGATFVYGAYGKVSQTGTSTTPLLFAQSYADPATGLDYLVNRNYNISTGQFDSVDPALSKTGEPYSYAGDDPVNASDPAGLCWGPECWVTHHWRGIAQAAVVVGAAALVAGCVGTVACILITAAAGAEAGVANYEIGSQSYSVSGALWSAAAGAIPGGFVWDVATDWYGNMGQAGETGYTAPSGSGSGASNASASSRSSAQTRC